MLDRDDFFPTLRFRASSIFWQQSLFFRATPRMLLKAATPILLLFAGSSAVFSFAGKLDYYARSSYLWSAVLARTAYFLAHPLFGRSFTLRFSSHPLPPLSRSLSLISFFHSSFFISLLSVPLTQLSRISKCCAVVKTTNSNGKPLVTGCLPLPRAASVILTEETSRPAKEDTARSCERRAKIAASGKYWSSKAANDQ